MIYFTNLQISEMLDECEEEVPTKTSIEGKVLWRSVIMNPKRVGGNNYPDPPWN